LEAVVRNMQVMEAVVRNMQVMEAKLKTDDHWKNLIINVGFSAVTLYQTFFMSYFPYVPGN
jgi:hypothetical protein